MRFESNAKKMLLYHCFGKGRLCEHDDDDEMLDRYLYPTGAEYDGFLPTEEQFCCSERDILA